MPDIEEKLTAAETDLARLVSVVLDEIADEFTRAINNADELVAARFSVSRIARMWSRRVGRITRRLLGITEQGAGQAADAAGVPLPDEWRNLPDRHNQPDRLPPAVAAYLNATGPLLDAVGERLAEQARTTLADGLAAGETPAQLADRLRNVFATDGPQLGETRAERIARTEATRAWNAGALGAARALTGPDRPLVKQWLTRRDPRVRDTHSSVDGQIRLLDEPFDVGGVPMNAPGDPAAPPELVVNCRCILALAWAGDRTATAAPSDLKEPHCGHTFNFEEDSMVTPENSRPEVAAADGFHHKDGMNMRAAAEKLATLLNELGAAGVEVEAAIGGLSLSTDAEPYGARVEPVDQTRAAWEVDSCGRAPEESVGVPTDPRPQVSAAADGSHLQGAMIALIPREEDATRIALDADGAEPAEQLHLTLYYLADDSSVLNNDERRALIDRIADYANWIGQPIQARIFGASHWNAGSDSPSWVWAVGDESAESRQAAAPTLQNAHEVAVYSVRDSLDTENLPDQYTPWAPHICAAYSSDPALLPALEEHLGPITFDRLRVAFAGDHTDIPLGTVQEADVTAGAPTPTAQFHGTPGRPSYRRYHPSGRNRAGRGGSTRHANGGWLGSNRFPEDEHAGVLGYYTGTGYKRFNRSLRNGYSDVPIVKERLQHQVAVLNDLINIQDPTTSETTLYRRMEYRRLELNEGDEFHDKGFVSTSKEEEVIPIDMEEDSLNYTFFRITVPPGAQMLDVESVGGDPYENEVILPPGTKFRVTRVVRPNNSSEPPFYELEVINAVAAAADAGTGRALLAKLTAADSEDDGNFLDRVTWTPDDIVIDKRATPQTRTAAAEPEQPVRWHTPGDTALAFENQQTGDGRVFTSGALYWEDGPWPLQYAPEMLSGHQGAQLAGAIEHAERDGNRIAGTGVLYAGNDAGAEAVHLLREGAPLGVSVDLDDVDIAVVVRPEKLEEDDSEGEPVLLASLASASVLQHPDGHWTVHATNRVDLAASGVTASHTVQWTVGADGSVPASELHAALTAAGIDTAAELAAAAGDPDDTAGEVVHTEQAGDFLMRITRARLRGATLVAMPAFARARIVLADDATASDRPAPGQRMRDVVIYVSTSPIPVTAADVAKALDMSVSQARDYLIRATSAGRLVRLSPGRYVGTSTLPEGEITASMSGDLDLPIHGDYDADWDGDKAASRVLEWATTDNTVDPDRLGAAFLYRNPDADPATLAAYKLGIADVFDGELHIVPRAVFAVAAVLQGARGGVDIPAGEQDTLRERVADLYDRIGDHFDRDITPPWDNDDDNEVDELEASAWQEMQALPPMPAAWFAEPTAEELPPGSGGVHYADGRIYGWVAQAGVPHEAFPGKNLTIESLGEIDTTAFLRTRFRLDDGSTVRVGAFTMNVGHHRDGAECETSACQFDDTRTVAGIVTVGMNSGGMWFSGAAAPWLSEWDRAVFAACQPSYHMRQENGRWALRAVLSVPVPGHPSRLAASAVIDRANMALAASAAPTPASADTGTDAKALAAALAAELRDSGILAAVVGQELTRREEAKAELQRLAEQIAPARAEVAATYAAQIKEGKN